MQWAIRLETTTAWGEVQTFEVGRLERREIGLAAHEIGLMLEEAKALLAELQRRIVQTQIDDKVMCERVCSDCLRVRSIRDQRTPVLQTFFGTVRVAAPRIKLCSCVDKGNSMMFRSRPCRICYPVAVLRNCSTCRLSLVLVTPSVNRAVSWLHSCPVPHQTTPACATGCIGSQKNSRPRRPHQSLRHMSLTPPERAIPASWW